MSTSPRTERLNLWIVCAAQFLTLAGMTAILPLLPLYLQDIGVTDRDAVRYWTGVLGSAPFIVAVFATPVWGTFADRVGHKPMVVRSVFGIALATTGMGFANSALAQLVRDRGTLALLALVVLFQVMIMASWPTLALFVEKLGVPRDAVATTTGSVIFVAGVPAMFISTAWARLGGRHGVERVMLLSLVLSGLAYAAVGFLARRVEVLFVLRLLSGVSVAGFIPLVFQLIGSRAPESARGRMAGLGSTAMMIGNVIGPLLGGWLAVHLDLAATFWVPGLAIAAVGIAFAAARAGRSA